ncbi:histidine kinase [Algoriphagus aestuariicola]|uniref:histidine kinase n=1 Tax=Algoriphagus aestuariicola TaxID=1852016 RepID=A0ABS3BTE1_9BACT|nr:ATP-binding protein [Algoriphagus aestuariicola]MBN7802141.1 histidine kinase [Algoriphagus aestuariicola]
MLDQESQVIAIVLSGIFFAGLMSVFVVAMVFVHRQRQDLARQKLNQLQAEHEKTLLSIENEIQQETLSQVGRELHDNIGQLLSLTKLNLNSSKPEKQAEGLSMLGQVIKEVRGLSKILNLDWVEALTLEDFLAQQLEKIQSTGFCQTELQSDLPLPGLPKEKKIVLIRVIQECLNNALKHAEPKQISVRISLPSAEKALLVIQDDGRGFDASIPSQGSGMSNLSSRMKAIGGSFLLTSKPGAGTKIILDFPI